MGDSAIPSLPWPHPLPARAQPALAVVAQLTRAGHRAYLVGGAVRDLLLALPPGDFDVATDATPDEILRLFPRTEEVGAAFGVVLVIQGDSVVETATFRTEGNYRDGRHPDKVAPSRSLSEDAARRDFTINGMYLDPAAGRILDPVGGIADCRNRRLRAVGDPARRFQEDGLRLLRAPRVAAQCGLEIDPPTAAAMAACKEGIRRISPERIGKEIGLILTGPEPARGLNLLLETGLLAIILPEVVAMKGVPQPPEYHPEGDVWTHTMRMFEYSQERSLTLGLAILLHDVGKPPTLTFADRIRFNGHAKLGAEMARAICQRLRLSSLVVSETVDLVAQHLRFLDVPRMRPATLKRFLRQDRFAEHLELHRLDCLGSHGDLGHYWFCRRALAKLKEKDLRPVPLLQGRDLLALGYPRGPLMGRILEALETAQLEGDVRSPEEAIAWVRRAYPPPAQPDQ
jgi:poly(A) polymerase